MAEEEEMEANGVEDSEDGERHNLRSLLASEDRDFLIRNRGCEVKVSDLDGKTVGLYFSGSWCGPCRRFTPTLAEAYKELTTKNSDFEIVFVSADEDEEGFADYFSKMPWLAIPFSDEDTRDSLNEEFNVGGIPTLVMIDKNGQVLTDEAVQVVRDYGADAYPFTAEIFKKLQQEEEAARLNQTISSLLITNTRDFLFTSNFKKVPVSELEGKTVGLYFSLSSFEACAGFTRRLVNFYNEMKGRGVDFEIVLVSLEEDEPAFMDDFEDMPWLGIPFKDKLCEKLVRYFGLEDLPTLTVIGTDGKTVNLNVVELIEDYGVDAYPFTSEKIKELKKKEKARIEAQSLETLLISGEKNFVIKNDGSKVPVSELVGKNILFYFSAHWCPPCRAFLPILIEVYNRIKEKDDAFEIILVSSDEDEESFDDYFSKMPWMALPFWDERNRFLSRVFKVGGIPSCVALNREGKTVTKNARSLIMEHGADAYPFTKEQIKLLKDQMEEKALNWPERIRHKRHKHVLLKSRRDYICDGCGKRGKDWSFYCKKCDFDLHPHCALDDDHDSVDSESDDDEEAEWPKKIKHMLHKHVLVKAWRSYQCDACGVVKQGYWSYFCEECDFDLHPECALGNSATAKVVDDSDDDEEDEEDDDEDDTEDEDDGIDSHEKMNGGKTSSVDDGDNVDIDDVQKSIRRLRFAEPLTFSDEEENSEISDGTKDEHEEDDVEDENEDDDKKDDDDDKKDDDDDNKEDDEKDDEEGDENDSQKGDEEDEEDGPSMRGYTSTTREREGSESFQETLFTCKLYK